jgi:hypothetical protein
VQALGELPEQTIAFGRPIAVVVSYSPSMAVKYNLGGEVIERLSKLASFGVAYLVCKNARLTQASHSLVIDTRTRTRPKRLVMQSREEAKSRTQSRQRKPKSHQPRLNHL